MIYYGIWDGTEWMYFNDYAVFNTPSWGVAMAQLTIVQRRHPNAEIREFAVTGRPMADDLRA